MGDRCYRELLVLSLPFAEYKLKETGSSVGIFSNCYARSVKYDGQSSIGLKKRVHFQSAGSHF